MKILSKNHALKLVADYMDYDISKVEDDYKRIEQYINLKSRQTDIRVEHHKYCGYEYLLGAVSCYFDYSSSVLNVLSHKLDCFNNVHSILDVAAGCGFTTLHLLKLFPNTILYYNNLKDSLQWSFAKSFLKQDNVKFVDENNVMNLDANIDMIFACDFYEHIETPVAHVKSLLSNLKPKFFIVANAFRLQHPDHLERFLVENIPISNTKIGRVFNDKIRELDYKMDDVTKSFWNRRPTVWRRDNV